MVERHQKRQRRRRRRVGAGCLTLSLLLAASPPSDAFTAVSTTTSLKRPLRRSILLYASETSLVLEAPASSSSEYDFATPKVELPPWLKRLEGYTEDDAMIHLDWLEYALLEEGFTFEDIRDIIQAVQQTSQDNVARLVGTIDFLRLILSLQDDGDSFCTKQVLLASVLHFSDCITVRETGVYEMVKRAVHGRKSSNNKSYRALAPSAREQRVQPEAETYDDVTRSLISATRRQELYTDAYEEYGEEVTRIARDAARVKRAEILAHVVLGRKPSKEEASRLRGLLLSVMDDWRALAIRAVACLYRLEGILYDAEQQGTAEYVDLSQETVKATREALHVYAPLAQRLGMQRLKAKLEDRAFRIMYRRQYGVVSTLYKENGAEMALVSSDLSSTIEQVLRQTPSLMEQLEDLQVTSRVKEPYSLWKKLLKLRHRGSKSSSSLSPSFEDSTGGLIESATEAAATTTTAPSELSLLDVQDGIAVRVILTARKWSPDEPEEITRNRERLLCYYVQKILSNYWPVVDDSRVKDYIRFPKSNGYQSLHYTSSVTTNDGTTWPFEVQVRSEEMHRIAEYGVAAHWDYKLGNKKIELLSPTSSITTSTKVQTTALPESATAAEDSYIDALVTARKDLVQQRVFVFFAGSSAINNMGHLLSLPVGARVSDAIDELKEQLDLDLFADVDESCVLRNGRVASPDEYIGNGDMLVITL